MNKEFSMEESEFILENFEELGDGSYATLVSALRDLASAPESPAPEQPPLLPSQVTEADWQSSRFKKRSTLIALAVSGLAVTSTLAAAALGGVGPKPVLHFVTTAVKSIESVAKKIFTSESNSAVDVSEGPDLPPTPVQPGETPVLTASSEATAATHSASPSISPSTSAAASPSPMNASTLPAHIVSTKDSSTDVEKKASAQSESGKPTKPSEEEPTPAATKSSQPEKIGEPTSTLVERSPTSSPTSSTSSLSETSKETTKKPTNGEGSPSPTAHKG